MTGRYVVGLRDVDETTGAVVGGKAARLGGLARLPGVRVPDGFCVTTDAFGRLLARVPSLDARLDALDRLDPDDRAGVHPADPGRAADPGARHRRARRAAARRVVG